MQSYSAPRLALKEPDCVSKKSVPRLFFGHTPNFYEMAEKK